ncbi:MAG: ATP synthase F1 subunit delta [Alphaproteobacteria bacterium]
MKPSKNKIAKALAQAFFEAQTNPKTHQDDLKKLQEILLWKKENPKFASFLNSPLFSHLEKHQIFLALDLPNPLIIFLEIILKQQMISYLDMIVHAYEKLVWESLNKIKGTVTVAAQEDLSPTFKKNITTLLEEKMNKDVSLTFETDPSLLGGFKLEVADFHWDSSLKNTLEQLRNSL